MLSEIEALERILNSTEPLTPQPAALGESLYRFAARSLLATVPLPGFDNSAMDGYALRAADSENSKPLRVVGEQPAGLSRELAIEAGETTRIFTGAPLPRGADAVIMQEDVEKLEDGARIACKEPVAPEENVRRTGCDICVGQRVLERGQRITAARIGILAAQGLSTVEVTATPRVMIVTTGDELAAAGSSLKPGQIYNSNGIMLQFLLIRLGVEKAGHLHLADDLVRTAEALRPVIASHDFVIMCGGVSVGDHDCVRPALEALQVKPEFWRVKIKPGKPLLYARTPRADGGSCTILGLPGNPVSAFVTFLIFARPALLKAMGAAESEWHLPKFRARLQTGMRNGSDRPHYVRGSFEGGLFVPKGSQQSHELFGLANSNALIRMEAGSSLEAGTEVSAMLFD